MKVFLKRIMAMTLAVTILAALTPYSLANEVNASDTGSKIEARSSNNGSEDQSGVMKIKLGLAKLDQDGNVSEYLDTFALDLA